MLHAPSSEPPAARERRRRAPPQRRRRPPAAFHISQAAYHTCGTGRHTDAADAAGWGGGTKRRRHGWPVRCTGRRLRPAPPLAVTRRCITVRRCRACIVVRAIYRRMAADGGADAAGGFDKSQFDSVLSLQALRVRKADVHELCVVLRRLGALFDMPRLCSVVADEACPEERLVLLNEAAKDAGEALPSPQLQSQRRTHSLSMRREQS